MQDDKKLKEKLAAFMANAALVNALGEDTSLELYFEMVGQMDTSSLDISGCLRDGVLTAMDSMDLAIFRHPDIEPDMKIAIRVILLALIEAQAGALKASGDVQVAQSVQEQLSGLARKAAQARHNHSNQQKVAALKLWDAYGENVSSVAAFARARHRDFDVTERTLADWIRAHRKTKS